MKTLFLYLNIISSCSAVWYDRNGNPIPNADASTPGAELTTVMFKSGDPSPWNGTLTTFGGGFSEPSCAFSLVKSWKGDGPPPPGLDAVAISSGRCMTEYLKGINSFSSLRNGKIIRNYRFSTSDSIISQFKAYINSYRQLGVTQSIGLAVKVINFAVSNFIDIAIVQFDRTALSLYNEKFMFYNLASQNLTTGTEIRNVGFHDISLAKYFMRVTKGRVIEESRPYNPQYGQQVTFSFQHNSNSYSTGGPIFKVDDNSTIWAIASEAQTTANFGVHVSAIKSCFRPTGEFTMNAPNCLNQFKLDYMSRNMEDVEGLRYIQVNETQLGNFQANVTDVKQALMDMHKINDTNTMYSEFQCVSENKATIYSISLLVTLSAVFLFASETHTSHALAL